MDTLGKRIAYYRKLQGLSQEKVAEHIGISRQAVTKWENDNSSRMLSGTSSDSGTSL